MIRPFLIMFSAMVLDAQPAIRTELRNGVVRAVVLHNSGDPVTDDAPALPGEPANRPGGPRQSQGVGQTRPGSGGDRPRGAGDQ